MCISRRRLLTYAAVASALATSGAGCRSRTAPIVRQPSASRPRRLTLSWQVDTGYPSPFTSSNLGPGGVVKLSLLFDSLVWKDERGLIPWLADSWEMQDDGRAITFKLREGVTWHDGLPFTADDVAFSFSYFAAHPFSWADTSVVESATVVDPRTISLRFARPFAPFLHDVAGVLPMLPRHIWSTAGDPLKFTGPGAVTGTGPFVFAAYSEGQGSYLFRANEHFFAGRPTFDVLAYELVPLEQQPLALHNGRVNAALTTDFDVQAKFQTGRYRVLATQPFSIMRLVFNVERPPFDRQEFRQALAFALDRRQIGARVIHGEVVIGHPGVIPPESPWFSADVTAYPYDPGRAGRLLDGLGYGHVANGGLREAVPGTPLRIQLLTDPNAPDAELIQAQLAQVGIGVEIVAADSKTRTDRLTKLDYQLGLLSHIGVGGDPDFLRLWYAVAAGNSNAFAQGNVLHNPEFSRLAEQQAAEMDDKRRHLLVARLQRILSEELPTLPLYHRRFFWISDSAFSNRWFNTWAGIMGGIPLAENKLALLRR